MVSGWSEIEEQLVEWFGLDQSKYQWAFDEFLERQLVSDCSLFLVICGNKDYVKLKSWSSCLSTFWNVELTLQLVVFLRVNLTLFWWNWPEITLHPKPMWRNCRCKTFKSKQCRCYPWIIQFLLYQCVSK